MYIFMFLSINSHQDRPIQAIQHSNNSTTRASYSHSPQTLERVSLNGSPSPLKTEAPRQTGPESRVPGRETPIPPASRRWVPPSLRPQHDLTPETQNDAVFRKVNDPQIFDLWFILNIWLISVFFWQTWAKFHSFQGGIYILTLQNLVYCSIYSINVHGFSRAYQFVLCRQAHVKCGRDLVIYSLKMAFCLPKNISPKVLKITAREKAKPP